MQLLSVNVGRPQERIYQGRKVTTSIFKAPVDGPVHIHAVGVTGDEQADLTVHGGPDKAVYLYPSEHYAYWREVLADQDLPFGAFGENLTTRGLLERVEIDDEVGIGTAVLTVAQPRMPCFKLGLRFDRADMVKRFWESGLVGFYLRVKRAGVVRAGDTVEIRPSGSGVSVEDVVRIAAGLDVEEAVLTRARALPLLPSPWRDRVLLRTFR